jgi:hypothetical protein
MATASTLTMTEELLDFIQTRVNSFIRWDLVRYFNDSPTRKETCEQVAKGTGRDVHTVGRELEGLVEVGILTSEDKAGVRQYKLVRDKHTRQLIKQFMQACHDRQFRIEAIQAIIKNMNFSPRYDF